jgi:hypothetical protein
MNNDKITAKQLEPFAEELEMLFDGNLGLAVDRFDELLYILYYIDPEVIPIERVQTSVYEIKQMRDSLKKIVVSNQICPVKYIPLGAVAIS